jgi:hypothetical protein
VKNAKRVVGMMKVRTIGNVIALLRTAIMNVAVLVSVPKSHIERYGVYGLRSRDTGYK